jgi:hypothetical protein
LHSRQNNADTKIPVIFYDIPSNSNGKMAQKAYITQILEPWIDRGDDFALEEDGDSGQGAILLWIGNIISTAVDQKILP